MMSKMKKIRCYLKNVLVMILITVMVGSSLLMPTVTVYAAQTTVTAQDDGTDVTSGESSQSGETSKTVEEDVTESTKGSTTGDLDVEETKEEEKNPQTQTSTQETNGEEQKVEGEQEEVSQTDNTKEESDKDKISTVEEKALQEKEKEKKELVEGQKYRFGSNGDISKDTVFDEESGYGFSDVDYNQEAKDWEDGVYYPREANKVEGASSYVEDGEDYVAISSQIWKETESSGYGVYTYENTSTLDLRLDAANYKVKVTLVNPTDSLVSAYLEAEDITKVKDIEVASGEEKEVEFIACLVDDVLNLKFLGASSATEQSQAETKTVYVKEISFEKIENESGDKPTIFLASDSTVQTYDPYYYPQMGWGQQFYNFFGEFIEERECEDANYSQSQTYETSNVIIENRSIGGRSSKSFIDEGKLDDLLEDVKPGDYLFVQWGHNDATKVRPNRYVSTQDFEHWIKYYIDGAKQRGATCVLVTPVARYSYNKDQNGELDSFKSDFEGYRNVMQQIASEQNVPLVDLTSLSIELCNDFGIEGAKSLFLHLAPGEYEGNYSKGVTDSTHLQEYGAYKFAQCVAKGIKNNEQLTQLAETITLTNLENKPEAPANLTIDVVGASSVTLTWEAAKDAELYYIYRQELESGQKAEDVDFTNAQKYSASAKTSYTDATLESQKTYVYAVAGFNELGVGELSNKITISSKDSAYKFDFGDSSKPNVMEGWTEVTENQMYSKEVGYGFIKAPGASRNRANNGNADSSKMADDFCLGEAEFALDLANGDYEVTIYAGDLLSGTGTIKASYTAEGLAIGNISTKQALASVTGKVRVTDGQLNIGIGGQNPYINGLEVTPVLPGPTQLSYSEMDFSTGNATFLINFTGIEQAVSYHVYQKASTDQNFTVVKDILASELDELSARAMSATLGETYQYYVTAVVASGEETAPSNTIEIVMLDKNVAVPKAPQNVKCDSAQDGEITISWDKSKDALSYIIYRSPKAETEKGFKEFVKVGTTTSESFTDKDSNLTTNVHYYYKVQGVNAGGLGERSEACKTPISGELVAASPEKLTDRGVVAVNLAGSAGGQTNLSATDKEGKEYTSGVYLSWRAFEADFDGNHNVATTFTVYRNNTPIASDIAVTNLVDEGGKAGDSYRVIGSSDEALGLHAKDIAVWDEKYLELQLYKPQDQVMPDGKTCSYHANDMSVGDIDGDGDYELFVKWAPNNAQDNSKSGYTGTTFIDAYDIDTATGEAKLLYRIDLGINIRSGAHYTQFQVWDFDGDNKAELAVKTADGSTIYQSTDGTDQGLVESGYVGECNADALPTDKVSEKNDYRNSAGYVLDGPEYFTMFDDDGTILSTTDYIPERGNVSAWGDGYGNRVDRFLSAVAYLDGKTPYAVFARGYYTRTTLTAYCLLDTDGDGIGDTLDVYWKFDTKDMLDEYDKSMIEGQGNHGLSVNDVDNDGKDEIIYGSMVIDHDGTLKYSTGLGHGDAMHVSDWVESNDGLEIMQVHEHKDADYHVEIHDAETGEILMGYYTGKDTGRGVAADIDPTYPAAEFWSVAAPSYAGSGNPAWDSKDGGVYSTTSTLDNLVTISPKSPAANFSIFWDGDLLSEIFDHTFNNEAYKPLTTTIAKWNYENSEEDVIFESGEVFTSNGTKGNAGLVADILGDWREEIIVRSSQDDSKIRIYSTTIQTDYVVPCLMENLAYREGVAWQNVAYNQPANLSYLLSEGVITAQVEIAKTSYDAVTIEFTPASDGTYGHEIEGYEIYRAQKDSTDYTLLDTIGAQQHNYTDTTVKQGTEYLYKVAAVVDQKTSFLSRAANVVVPTNSTDPTDPTDPTIEHFTVVFESNGGSEVASQSIESGKMLSQPQGPVRVGYTFDGWYKDSTFTQKWNFEKDGVVNNITLYAKWNEIKVNSITLNEKQLTIGVGTKTTLSATVSPEEALNKEVTWSSSNEKIATINQSGVIKAKKKGTVTITATAKDGSNKSASCKITVGYKITYKLNGGTNHKKNLSGFVGNKAVKLNTPTKKGYTFKGWYTDKNYKTKITKIKKGTKKNITVYAKWEKIKVDKASIKNLKNSGKGKMKVSLDKVSDAKGYEIVYATNSKFTKNVKKITTKSKNKTFKNLKKKSTYYVKVRAYKLDKSGNKIYGKYSTVKKVQIKK